MNALWFKADLKKELRTFFEQIEKQIQEAHLSESELTSRLKKIVSEAKKHSTTDSFGSLNQKAAAYWQSFISDMEKVLYEK